MTRIFILFSGRMEEAAVGKEELLPFLYNIA